MIDYTLKFPDEAIALIVLEPLDNSYSIDIIGTILKDTLPILGWHVNVRGPENTILNQYHIDVKTPVRVWA